LDNKFDMGKNDLYVSSRIEYNRDREALGLLRERKLRGFTINLLSNVGVAIASFFVPLLDFKQCVGWIREHAFIGRDWGTNHSSPVLGLKAPWVGVSVGHTRRENRQGPAQEYIRQLLHIVPSPHRRGFASLRSTVPSLEFSV